MELTQLLKSLVGTQAQDPEKVLKRLRGKLKDNGVISTYRSGALLVPGSQFSLVVENGTVQLREGDPIPEATPRGTGKAERGSGAPTPRQPKLSRAQKQDVANDAAKEERKRQRRRLRREERAAKEGAGNTARRAVAGGGSEVLVGPDPGAPKIDISLWPRVKDFCETVTSSWATELGYKLAADLDPEHYWFCWSGVLLREKAGGSPEFGVELLRRRLTSLEVLQGQEPNTIVCKEAGGGADYIIGIGPLTRQTQYGS